MSLDFPLLPCGQNLPACLLAWLLPQGARHLNTACPLFRGYCSKILDATTKGCWNYAYASFLKAPPGRNLKDGWDQTEGAKQFFKDNELGSAPIFGSLFVIGGEADETVPIAALRATAAKACRNGIALTLRTYPGLDHDPTMDKSTPDQLAWVRERLAGAPAANSCPTLAQ